MGAQEFSTIGFGGCANSAYNSACYDANEECGHQEGYNGTISTTFGYKVVTLPSKMVEPKVFTNLILDAEGAGDEWKCPAQYRKFESWIRRTARIIEKRGPCVCFQLTGARATKVKAQYGRKGSHDKVFVYVGVAAC